MDRKPTLFRKRNHPVADRESCRAVGHDNHCLIRHALQIAQKAAKDRGQLRMSAQAVGGAVGRNPISIIVPCHRVIGSRGALVGYGGGLDRKEYLLNLEGITYQKPATKVN